MSASDDTPKDIDACASEPITFHVTPHIKHTIQRAAALSGKRCACHTFAAKFHGSSSLIWLC